MPKVLPVLFTHFGDEWIRGSEIVLLDLLGALDKEKIRPIVWCNGADMAQACRSAGYATYRDDFRHMFDYSSPRPSASHYFSLLRRCRTLCRDHDIRVLHANSLAPVQWLAPTGMTRRIPVLAHLHIDYLRRSRYALLLHAVALAVGVSRQAIEGPLQDGIPPERTRVIYNGIDFARVGRSNNDLRAQLGIPASAFVIGSIGSLIRRKGHDVLINAFFRLPSGSIPPHLVIAGSGPELDTLRELALTLGIAGRVHFLGNVSDVAQVYQAADLFALASRGDACPLVLAEAGYFGLPAVSTRVGGIPELVLHGQTGLLVPPDDAEAFSAALTQLTTDRSTLMRLGTAAARRMNENFTADRMARQFEKAYAELAALPKRQLGWTRSVLSLAGPYSKLLRPQTRPQQRYAS